MAPQVDAASERDRRRGQTGHGQAVGSPDLGHPLTPLQQRIASSAVLLPVALFALWSGGVLWTLLIGLFAVVMAWEWAAICAERRPVQVAWPSGRPSIAGLAMITTVALSLLIYGTAWLPDVPLWVWPVAGAAVTFLLAWPSRGWAGLWLVLGVLYIVAGALAAIALRAQPVDGLATEIWIIALVVAVDTGAYAAGRTIGGPKLLPRISPSKTWAGLAGAILSAGVIGALAAALLDRPTVWPLAIASGLLAVVGQAGDLFESFLKRHFGVKDSGRIIPGHGGVLDRVDGLLAVVLAVAILERIFGGGILEWL